MHHLDSCNILLSYKQSQLSEAIIEHHIKCRKEAARRKQWKQKDWEKAVDDVLEHGNSVQTAAALHGVPPTTVHYYVCISVIQQLMT